MLVKGSVLLKLIEDRKAKDNAQRELESVVKAALKRQGIRNIGFPSGNRDEVVYSNGTGKLYCAFGSAEDAKIPRRWNAFGVFDERRHAQMITVEINIPTTTNSASVAGFFARDPYTDTVYLMHDGSVGGGKKGVSRNAFLWWTAQSLVEVERPDGRAREGVVIGRVNSRDLPSRLWRYVQSAHAFKDAVNRGEISNAAVRKLIGEWEGYRRESSGRRRGSRRSEIDYISYHGDIVELLKQELERKRPPNSVKNSRLIDLYVRPSSQITEIYEVKTSLQRQSLYTGIGQLLSHSASEPETIQKTLVLPEGDLPFGMAKNLNALGIRIRRYHLKPGVKPKIELI